jgi:hypothetical protein
MTDLGVFFQLSFAEAINNLGVVGQAGIQEPIGRRSTTPSSPELRGRQVS